jgi:serine/threonine-protein kinase
MPQKQSASADESHPLDDGLFDLLDKHVEALQAGDQTARTLDVQDVAATPRPQLSRLLDCLNALERLAPVRGLSQPPAAQVESSMSRRQSLGQYQLLGEIGRGGMGVVYRARHSGLHADVALKVIRSSDLASAEEVRRFHQEARAAAGLSHPGIIRVHDVGECDGLHYLTMDLVEGSNLASVLRNGPMSPEQSALLMAGVARAVHYLHTRGIVHRDLKPANILLDQSGQPYVSDFGLAKVFASEDDATLSGTIIGTPDYMSPEQASGRTSVVTPLSDVFSLGAILYELLTGQAPFHGANPLDTLLQVLEGEPTLPRKLNRRVPSDLEQICLRCLEKSPERRYPSAEALAADLQRFADREPITLPPVSLKHRLRRLLRREPALISHLLAIGLAAVIVQGRAFVTTVDPQSHGLVMGILAAWAMASWTMQSWMRRERFADAARYVWSAIDVVLLTTLLHISESWGWRTDVLTVGYPLMITGAALWFRVRLIWFMTAVCVLSYVALWFLHSKTSPEVPGHFLFIVTAIFVIIGANVSYQVYRFKLLDRVYQRRGDGNGAKV